jgi:hypothetical protein
MVRGPAQRRACRRAAPPLPAHRVCQLPVEFTGEVLHDMLAAVPASTSPPSMSRCARRRGSNRPRLDPDCGQAFKVLLGGIPARPDDRFHRILDDGLLGELVGTICGKSQQGVP